jgi:glycosyltransferase involved in cell wall biosynthesis
MPFTPISDLKTAEMHVPQDDETDPEVSIVVPALNEELTIADFVDWCQEGIAAAGVRCEIVIVDSSVDATPEIALAHGARVLRVPKRGLGRAYRDSFPFIRGQYVIMGDADCTYDFRLLMPFISALRAGNEFVMGSRFKGKIEADAMPKLHRYLGTPVTTSLLNRLFGTRFSDIHCGMRAATKEALIRMDMRADGWEYSSEMILKALHLHLRVTEVPVDFYKDRNGRVSNVKRAGALTAWKAGWETLRVLFTNGADFFLYKPGLIVALIGLFGVAFLSTGPRVVGPVTMTLHAESLFMTLGVIGLLCVFMGIFARCLYDPGPTTADRWHKRFQFTRVAIIASFIGLFGLAIEAAFVYSYIDQGYRVNEDMKGISHMSIAGLTLLVTSFIIFVGSLVISAVAEVKQKRPVVEYEVLEPEPVPAELVSVGANR